MVKLKKICAKCDWELIKVKDTEYGSEYRCTNLDCKRGYTFMGGKW